MEDRIWLSCLLGWVQEALSQAVAVIFEDPGVKELIGKLYQKGYNLLLNGSASFS